jgi:adenine-specific DNA methylase
MSDQAPAYPKRLIEVDLPIARISAHARREKSIRHGHISTLHIWWARRPLAACRAVICAALWPDPADQLCPPKFRQDAYRILAELKRRVTKGGISPDQRDAYEPVSRMNEANDANDYPGLRKALLDFIAEFANWDLSANKLFLETSRALTQSAHESLGGEPGTRSLVVDPFAGGGSIPLETLRVGADAFASDLNPVPVLLNKVILEYIPKYGQQLADEVRTWGHRIKQDAENELSTYYPKDPDGSTPIAYLWARTILSEAPEGGDIAVEVPLMRSLWLAKRPGRYRALRWKRDQKGCVETSSVEVLYADGLRRKVRRPLLEIFEPQSVTEVEPGTVARGHVTCPVTGYTTKVDRVRAQLKMRRGGAADARMFCVVLTQPHGDGRFYRLPTARDDETVDAAASELARRIQTHGNKSPSLVPDEIISLNELRRISVPIYGIARIIQTGSIKGAPGCV